VGRPLSQKIFFSKSIRRLEPIEACGGSYEKSVKEVNI
jgi:hypothetical protein